MPPHLRQTPQLRRGCSLLIDYLKGPGFIGVEAENVDVKQIFDAGPEKMSEDPYESGVLWMRANLDYGLGLRDQPPQIVSDFSTRF